MKKSRLCIVGFERKTLESNVYFLNLESRDRQNRLNIPLNEYESKVVAHIFSNGKKNQLYAYGSMVNLLVALEAKIESAEFQMDQENQLVAFLLGKGTFGTPFRTLVRPVDAIIFSILNRCPIYCVEPVEEASCSDEQIKTEPSLQDLSLKSLRCLLEEYLTDERYEEACVVRDIIKARQAQISMLSHV